MNRNGIVLNTFLWASFTALAACTRVPNARSEEAMAVTAPPQSAALPPMIVHKSPNCGCCGRWVDHLRHAGFQVEVRNSDNLDPVKQRVGVPKGKASCHTAEVGGYFIEGHVPAADIKRLLAEKPDSKGLVLPGMPTGSPGMESPDGRIEHYTVELVGRNGATTAFAQHGQ